MLPVWGLRKQNYFFGYLSSENQAHKAQTFPTMKALPAGPTNHSPQTITATVPPYDTERLLHDLKKILMFL